MTGPVSAGGEIGARLVLARRRGRYELQLPAGAVERGNHLPSAVDRGLLAVVLGEYVETQVESGGDAGAGQDASLVDVQRCGVDRHVWVLAPELLGVLPVSGGAVAVEESGASKGERTGRNRHHTGAPLVGVAKSLQGLVENRSAVEAGHDDGVASRSASRPVLVVMAKPEVVCSWCGTGAARLTRKRSWPAWAKTWVAMVRS